MTNKIVSQHDLKLQKHLANSGWKASNWKAFESENLNPFGTISGHLKELLGNPTKSMTRFEQ